MSEAIQLYPLVFTLQNAIEGCGFLAGITLRGKAVMECDENGEWWLFGVCPGAIAAGGETPNEAFLNFTTRYKEVLLDVAEECADLHGFTIAVEEFFAAEDAQESARWKRGLKAVRRNKADIPESFKKLPRKKAEDFLTGISIERLDNKKRDQFRPANNVLDSMAQAA